MSVVKLEPFEPVLFGGTGDLAMRKLISDLYQSFGAGQIDSHSRILGAADSWLSREDYIARSEAECRKYLADGQCSQTPWRSLSKRLEAPGVDAASLAACAASGLTGRDGYGVAR
jgi:glucose-6-phosphate 1-dehydrogenase